MNINQNIEYIQDRTDYLKNETEYKEDESAYNKMKRLNLALFEES